MKVKSINYQRTFNTLNYSSERIGIEIDVNEGDDVVKVFDEAKAIVEKYHHDNNPHLYSQQAPEIPIYKRPEPPKEPEKPLTKTESTIKAINSFTELKGANGLESFKLIVKSNPELQEAYNKKLKELS